MKVTVLENKDAKDGRRFTWSVELDGLSFTAGDERTLLEAMRASMRCVLENAGFPGSLINGTELL